MEGIVVLEKNFFSNPNSIQKKAFLLFIASRQRFKKEMKKISMKISHPHKIKAINIH